MQDLMSALPAPQPVSNIDTRVYRPHSMSTERLLNVLNRHMENAAADVKWQSVSPDSVQYREAVAVRDALRELTLDVLSMV